MELQLLPPFPGPVPAAIPNPIGTASVLGAFALAGVGIGFGIAAHRKATGYGKLLCENVETEGGEIVPLVGVAAGYQGDWWAQRGRRLYWKARRGGARSATQIAQRILVADLGETSVCMGQFPPRPGTHERNRGIWESLIENIHREMASEG